MDDDANDGGGGGDGLRGAGGAAGGPGDRASHGPAKGAGAGEDPPSLEAGRVEGFAPAEVIVHRVRVGDREVRLFAPRDPHVLAECQDQPEDTRRLPFWARVWPGSAALADHLLGLAPAPDGRARLAGRRVLELGCGLGLAGIGAALAGARVTATDRSEVALRFAAANHAANGCPGARTAPLTWARDLAPLAEPYPLVIGADLLYDPRHVAPLFATLVATLAPGGAALLVDPFLVGRDLVRETAAAYGFAVRLLGRAPERRDLPPATEHRPFPSFFVRFERTSAGL